MSCLSSDSSGDEDDTEPENEHVKHQKESWATIRKLTGQVVRAPRQRARREARSKAKSGRWWLTRQKATPVLAGATWQSARAPPAAPGAPRRYPSDEIEYLIGQNPKPTPRPGSREENEKHKDFVLAELRAFQAVLNHPIPEGTS